MKSAGRTRYLQRALFLVLLTALPACSPADDPGSEPSEFNSAAGGQSSGATGGSTGTDASEGTPSGTGGSNVDVPPNTEVSLVLRDYFPKEGLIGRIAMGATLSSCCDEWIQVFGGEGIFSTLGDVSAIDSASEVWFELEPSNATSTGELLLWDSPLPPGGGEIVTLSTTGGSVAAFTASVQIPLAPLLTSHQATPVPDGTAVITVSRSEDLVITWDARDTSEAVWAIPASVGDLEIAWYFDAAPGVGVIPASDLEQLPAGDTIFLMAVNLTRVETAQGYFDIWGQFKMVTSPDKADFAFLVP